MEISIIKNCGITNYSFHQKKRYHFSLTLLNEDPTVQCLRLLRWLIWRRSAQPCLLFDLQSLSVFGCSFIYILCSVLNAFICVLATLQFSICLFGDWVVNGSTICTLMRLRDQGSSFSALIYTQIAVPPASRASSVFSSLIFISRFHLNPLLGFMVKLILFRSCVYSNVSFNFMFNRSDTLLPFMGMCTSL